MDKYNKSHIMWVTKAAFMLALLLVVQLVPFNQIIKGSLVNMVLVVGSGTVGFAVVSVAAILSPIFAFILGQMPFPQLVLVIAIGNLIIVAITWAFFRNRNKIKFNIIMDLIGIILGSVAKCAFLWGAMIWVMVPLFFTGNPKANAIIAMFSWPQLITAIIGGSIAIAILPALRKYKIKN